MEIFNITDIIKILLPVLAIPILFKLYKQHVLVLNFLWKRFIGKPLTIKNKTIRKIAEQQLDLANIRLMYPQFHFRNIYHAKAIIKWCNKLRIGIDDISSLSSKVIYNENESPKVRLNDKGILIDKIATFAFIVICGATTILAGSTPFLSGVFGGIWLRMNEANHYVWVEGTESAHRITASEPKPPALLKENCTQPFSETYALTEAEVTYLCKYFNDEKSAKKYQEKILKRSIWMAASICPIFSIAFFLYLFSFFKINRVSKLSKIVRRSEQACDSKINT
jgi:hypothetical protein